MDRLSMTRPGYAVTQDGAEVIRTVDLDQGVERVATPAEIESGIFYKDHDDYIRKDAAA